MYDIIIIGGGPAGLTAALYAGRAGKHTLVIEKSAFSPIGRKAVTAKPTGAVIHQKAIQATVPIAARAVAVGKIDAGRRK